VVEFVVAVAAGLIVAAILGFTKWGRGRLARVFHRRSMWPRAALRLVPQPQTCWWHPGAVGDKAAMQIVGTWRVTARDDVTTAIVRSYVRAARQEHDGATLAIVDGTAHNAANWPIGKDSMWKSIDVRISVFVVPRLQESGTFKTTVVFVDSYGNKYRQKTTFRFS
jgi:pimeloyl-ACP methyl ester carboxylesterase